MAMKLVRSLTTPTEYIREQAHAALHMQSEGSVVRGQRSGTTCDAPGTMPGRTFSGGRDGNSSADSLATEGASPREGGAVELISKGFLQICNAKKKVRRFFFRIESGFLYYYSKVKVHTYLLVSRSVCSGCSVCSPSTG